MSAWIKMIKDDEANEDLKKVLSIARTPHGTVDNVMRVHSLRPNTMKGHLVLYKSVLHDDANTIPTWFQETMSSYVSIINDCKYSLANHWANACHLINDKIRSKQIKEMKEEAKQCSEVILGGDADREGEAICWHIANLLKLPKSAT